MAQPARDVVVPLELPQELTDLAVGFVAQVMAEMEDEAHPGEEPSAGVLEDQP